MYGGPTQSGGSQASVIILERHMRPISPLSFFLFSFTFLLQPSRTERGKPRESDRVAGRRTSTFQPPFFTYRHTLRPASAIFLPSTLTHASGFRRLSSNHPIARSFSFYSLYTHIRIHYVYLGVSMWVGGGLDVC